MGPDEITAPEPPIWALWNGNADELVAEHNWTIWNN
jgi:hypothetical protein